jgi:hypothetical protein
MCLLNGLNVNFKGSKSKGKDQKAKTKDKTKQLVPFQQQNKSN